MTLFTALWDASHDDAIQLHSAKNAHGVAGVGKNTNWLWSIGGGLTHGNPHDDNELNNVIKF
eukprot:CAMPEP_0113729976 /NCGR_PEP_ID=MMETSP0038_2-20120614/42889_1 /TAXON_ID=2898 /ORGANISM="Cryptomonas paramecium" /LENGTH=61 /DNA_ID=CAMNT_0000661959 /DNA_START=41 /DNA_END=226 /DNA_ORIENTATION=+ /assembly_acc=CAM_ASM_000170